MTVDNMLYEHHADAWWDEGGYHRFLLTGANPARFDYFLSVLERRDIDCAKLRLLDLGSGGGYLAEAFAGLGATVVGIDPARNSVSVAATHARSEDLAIGYGVATGEQLPFDDASFDAVTCCDVLEHLYDPDTVLREAARVLKPGGVFFFDTINRTPQSWLLMVQVAQEFPLTRIMPTGLHDWCMFIKPDELESRLAAVGIRTHQTIGLNTGRSPIYLLLQILQVKVGQITHGELGRRTLIRAVPGNFSLSYMGYGVKK